MRGWIRRGGDGMEGTKGVLLFFRQIGKYKSISTETVAVKQNDVS